MEEFADATALLDDPTALRRRLAADSHLFFRRLLAPEAVLAVREAVTARLSALGWLAPGTDPMDAAVGPAATGEGHEPSPAFFRAYTEIQRTRSFHELAHAPALVRLAESILGTGVLVHPRHIFRATPPDDPTYTTPPHQDFPLVQGAVDVLTAWIPIGDCPDELGGLRVLAGSHVDGVRALQAETATGGVRIAVDDTDPRWRSTDFAAGDVLVFHALTVHGAKPNRTGALRLSADYRYQRLRDPVHRGSLLPHYHPTVPGYDELSAGWPSTDAVAVPAGLTVVDGAVDPFDPALASARSALVGGGPQERTPAPREE